MIQCWQLVKILHLPLLCHYNHWYMNPHWSMLMYHLLSWISIWSGNFGIRGVVTPTWSVPCFNICFMMQNNPTQLCLPKFQLWKRAFLSGGQHSIWLLVLQKVIWSHSAKRIKHKMMQVGNKPLASSLLMLWQGFIPLALKRSYCHRVKKSLCPSSLRRKSRTH